MKTLHAMSGALLVVLIVSTGTVDERNPPREVRPAGEPLPDVGPIGSDLLTKCLTS